MFNFGIVIENSFSVKSKFTVMGYNQNSDNIALGNGGAGSPEAWDIITSSSHDLGGKIVIAFMNLTDTDGAFSAMKEETTMAKAGKAGVSEAVAAKYLGYTYPQNVIFEGRYTLLTPTTGTFKVWFLK
jgi:hypothetical protein